MRTLGPRDVATIRCFWMAGTSPAMTRVSELQNPLATLPGALFSLRAKRLLSAFT
jgi:hypothetical protein